MSRKFLAPMTILLLSAPLIAAAQSGSLDYHSGTLYGLEVTTAGALPSFSLISGAYDVSLLLGNPLAANLTDATIVPTSWSATCAQGSSCISVGSNNAAMNSTAAFQFSTDNSGSIVGWGFSIAGTLGVGGTDAYQLTSSSFPSVDTFTYHGTGPNASTVTAGAIGGSGGWRSTFQAPEINPAAASSGLALILGVIAVLSGRRKLIPA